MESLSLGSPQPKPNTLLALFSLWFLLPRGENSLLDLFRG